MPPTGYLSAAGIEACLTYLASTYPSICQLIPLPEPSVEGLTSRAIKIARGSGSHRHGVLFIGGVHARELINPDLLVSLALNLCRAFTAKTGLTFGAKTYSAETIQLLVRGLDIFIFPLVNPDGRVHVQKDPALGGDPMWRKNRRVNAGTSCRGADLNRNYDFLWSANLNASSNPCDYQNYKGPSAFSEPETRNVRHLLDAYPNIECMIDVHSHSEVILHPWGDDENQFTDTAMNFLNPAFNGLRGTVGDTRYKEYIRAADHNWIVDAANDVRAAIAAVRGRAYTVKQSALLYNSGISGSSKDYAFSRHVVDGAKAKVHALVVETATEFQPPYAEALNVIAEVSSGLIRFCLSCQCAVEETVSGTDLMKALDDWRAFRDNEMRRSVAGRNYIRLLETHTVELLQLVVREGRLREQAIELLRRVDGVVRSRHDAKPKTFDAELITEAGQLAERVVAKGSPALKQAIAGLRADLKHFSGKTAAQGLRLASTAATRKRKQIRS